MQRVAKNRRLGRLPTVLGVVLPCLLLFACGSTTPTSRFYVLSPTGQPPAGVVGRSVIVGVEPVRLPAAVDRSQMLTYVSTNQRQLAELDRWAEPLGENMTRVIGQNLEARLGPASVYSLPSRFAPPLDYVVSIEVLEFDAVFGGACSLRARIHLVDGQGRWVASRLVHAVASGSSDGAAGVAEAMSSNLDTLCDTIVELLP